MHAHREIRLAPPGSGLPPLELLFGRALFGGLRLGWSRAAALRTFSRRGHQILARLQGLDDKTGARPVLVPRLMGLEDSSRHWSPFMIAQHLFIVNRDALIIIESLCDGHAPAGEVRMENIKPQPAATRAAVEDLERMIHTYEQRIPELAGWPGTARHRHPWFGLLNAHGWLCMVAMHHGIHRRQLERVLHSQPQSS